MGSLGSRVTPGGTALSRMSGPFVSCPIVMSPFQRCTCAGQSIDLEDMACTPHFRLLQLSELWFSKELDKNHSYLMGRSRKMTMSWPFLQKVWEKKLVTMTRVPRGSALAPAGTEVSFGLLAG